MEISIAEFASIGIVGAVVSLIVEIIKDKAGTNSNETRLLTVVFAIVAGTILWAVQHNAVLWQNILAILATATTVYALIVKGLKDREDV